MRYLLRKVRKDGTPALGTINSTSGEYVSDENAIRFMLKRLRHNAFEPGQYVLTTWPKFGTNSTPPEREVCFLYKQAPGERFESHAAIN